MTNAFSVNLPLVISVQKMQHVILSEVQSCRNRTIGLAGNLYEPELTECHRHCTEKCKSLGVSLLLGYLCMKLSL